MEDAKRNLDRVKDNIEVSVDKKDMHKPKIQICDVDESEDCVIESIKEKNQWIRSLITNENDFKLIKTKKSRQEDRVHVIVKCSPQIRRAIHDNDNNLYTTYGRCKVYDSYQTYQCYKCQEFGHSANRCSKTIVCAKCSQEHKTKDCKENTLRCHNCARKGHSDYNHRTYDRKCPVYIEEIARIKNKTDHGF